MAKIKYNIKLWADTAANLATDKSVYKENDFIFATDSGVLKKGDGVKTYADLVSIGAVAAWGDITDKPSTFKPSAHDHTLAQVNGLQTALDGKAAEGHSHAWASITGKPSTFAPSAHNHAWADITAKPVVIASGATQAEARTAIGAGTGNSNLEIGTTASTAKVGNYQPTWAQVTGKPTTFAPSAHDHAVVADGTTDLEAAETLQGLAEALSARIADLDNRVGLLEEAPAG